MPFREDLSRFLLTLRGGSFTNNAESLFLQVEVESILYIHIA